MRAGSLVRMAVGCAVGLSACTGGAQTSSSATGSGGSGTSGASSSSSGSSTGTTGATTGGSGPVDAGCVVGSPSGLPEGSTCLFPFDCGCGLLCGSDVSGVGANLVCEHPCAIDSDCPLPGEHCQTSLGFCQGGLGGSCADGGSPNLEFYGCKTNSDCPCPLECYGDPKLGPACERPCDQTTSCGANEYCNVAIGSCQESCNPEGLVSVFQACQEPTDCRCPFSCFGDFRRGQVCELPCKADSDCGTGEICEPDAGSCQRTSDCFGVGGGLPPLSLCVNLADCACPLSCVDDPALRPAGTTDKYCELCDGGSCQGVTGSCQPQGDGGYQSSDATPCHDNAECTCPNTCLGSVDLGGLRCEQTCTSSADCDDPAQFCVQGQCVENYCNGQLACDLFDGRDDPPDAGDGTCLRLPPYTDYVCRVNGTATGQCDPQASRSNPAGNCIQNFACVASFTQEGSTCARACAVNTDCGPGGYCEMDLGLCLEPGGGGDGGPANCLPGAVPNDGGVCQFGECTAPLDGGVLGPSDDLVCGTQDPCTCPEQCVPSLGKGYYLCEQGCRTDSDCDDPGQACSAGQCVDNDCPGTALLCDLDGNSSDGGKGTCLPADFASNTLACIAPGTATGTCSQGGSRGQSAQRCASGFTCLSVPDGGLACLPACISAGDCGQGQTCVPSTMIGVSICLPLGDGGTCAVGQSSPPASDACGYPGSVACGCGYGCVAHVCDQLCQRDSDCVNPSDVCQGTVDLSYCVPGGL